MNTISISRRKFAQLLSAGAAAALVRPALSVGKPTEHSATSADVVRLSANENPYGPSPKALKAMTDSFGLACRYPDEHNNVLIERLAKLNNVGRDQILLGDGSGEILKLCAETFTGSQNGKLVAANPTFEAILNNASANGAEVVKVPLPADFAHDLSKIYGMAGLRCGYCVAQKETIERMRLHQMWDSVNIMALAAAIANLDDPDQVPNGQRLTSEAKAITIDELDKMGYKTIPSQANFIMFDCKRPVVPLIQAMKQRTVEVGRLFPALPNYMRVTIGKKSEMESFLNAFKQVMA